MRWRVAGALLTTAGALLFLPAPAAGQFHVSIGGQVESIAGLETRRTTRTGEDGGSGASEQQRFLYGSRYAPTADGVIWHRRFLTYSAGGVFADQTTSETAAQTEFLHTEPYRLQLNFFPEARHSFTLRAQRSTFETETALREGPPIQLTTTNETQGFNWAYRGSRLFPSGGLDFNRSTTTTDAQTGETAQTLTTLGLYGTKSFARANPTLRYRLDMLDDQGQDPATEGSRIGHTFEYSDRIRIGERLYVTPAATYQIDPVNESLRSATTIAVPFAGPIDPTLDGAANVRYSLGQGEELTHSLAGDGTLTKRLRPDLTLSGGLNSTVIRGEESSLWSTGGFANVDAVPIAKLRMAANYGLSVSGAEPGVTVGHRGQLQAISTHVPRHTFTGVYSVNLIDAAGAEEPILAQTWRLSGNSLALPRTTLDGSYGLELQEGNGSRVAHDAVMGATVTPPLPVAFRAAVDFSRRSDTDPLLRTTTDTGWGAQAGIDATPFSWLTLNVLGRRGVQHVDREGQQGEFVSDRLTGGAGVSWRVLQLRADGFLEREELLDRVGRGVRGAISYRFRVWTLSLELEQSQYDGADSRVDQQRVFFRITRPLSHFFSLR